MRSGRNIWGRLFDGRSTTTRPIFYKNMEIVHILIDFLAEIAYSDNRRRLLEKQTHKNAFGVCRVDISVSEAEPVMACGDCGDFVKGGNLP